MIRYAFLLANFNNQWPGLEDQGSEWLTIRAKSSTLD